MINVHEELRKIWTRILVDPNNRVVPISIRLDTKSYRNLYEDTTCRQFICIDKEGKMLWCDLPVIVEHPSSLLTFDPPECYNTNAVETIICIETKGLGNFGRYKYWDYEKEKV